MVKLPTKNKANPVYDPDVYRVTSVKDTRVTASRHYHEITRNSSFFKEFRQPKELEGIDHLGKESEEFVGVVAERRKYRSGIEHISRMEATKSNWNLKFELILRIKNGFRKYNFYYFI